MKGVIQMRLGEKVLKLRKKFNISQEQLGEQVGVTRQTISNWELGETSPNPEQLKLLSKALNISIDELLENDIKSVEKDEVNKIESESNKFLKVSKTIGIIISMLFITIFYYTYTGIIGMNYTALNILSFILAVLLSEYITYLTIKNNKYLNIKISIIILFILCLCFIFFTYIPPKINYFKDPITDTFGIYKIKDK